MFNIRQTKTSPKRPLLRYFGGKFVLAPWIVSHFPEHRIYVEPYGGAASPLFYKPRCYSEVYNDIDSEIVNVFRVMRDPVAAAELERQLRLTPFSRVEYKKAYDLSPDPVEQARRTIVKSFMGFGSNSITHISGFRNDVKRRGTTPAHDWMHYPDHIQSLTARLQGVVIESMDAIQLIHKLDDADALFYVDPTYVHSTRGRQHRYRHEMTDEQHEQLAGVLHNLKAHVVLSGYPSKLYDKLYGDWRRVERGALADGTGKRREVLWITPRSTYQALLDL